MKPLLRSGLVSVTFRKLPPAEVARLASEAGLACIEWGGDVHVPHGNLARAKEVRALSSDHGLAVTSYGSYYRLGESESADGTGRLSFSTVIETATELGAPRVRVWAGSRGSADADDAHRSRVVDDLARIGAMADSAGLEVGLEYHASTLTDSRESTLDLLARVPLLNVKSLWQPPHGRTPQYNAESLDELIGRLAHVHVFHWWPGPDTRLPLIEGADRWQRYIDVLRSREKPADLLLEFVPNDDPERFKADARTLRSWISQ